MPGAQCTRSLVCESGGRKCTRVFTASSPESPGIPTQWFTAYSALSLVTGLRRGFAIMGDPARNGSAQRAEFGALHRELQAGLLDIHDR
jgi:hypothetical protein